MEHYNEELVRPIFFSYKTLGRANNTLGTIYRYNSIADIWYINLSSKIEHGNESWRNAILLLDANSKRDEN